MKLILCILICLCFSQITRAQVKQQSNQVTAQAPGNIKPSNKPLFLIYYRDSIVNKSDSLIATLNPQYIKSVYVLRDKKATDKYGDAASSGAVEIYIKNKNYPQVYNLLRQTSGSNKN